MRVGRRGWRWLLALALGLLVAAGAARAQAPDWSGVWESRWRDGGAVLFLTQEGDLVTGTYPTLDGVIRAEARGRLLVGTWRERGRSGEFVFALAPDGRSFTGRFGTGEWWTGQLRPEAASSGAVLADASTPKTSFRSFVFAGNSAEDDRRDRVGTALDVLDFTEVAPELRDTASKRVALAAELFDIIDLLTFRIWSVPTPAPGEDEVIAELEQAGTGETARLRFRYGVRDTGAAGWFIVVPPPDELTRTRERLLAARGRPAPYPRAHHELTSPRDTMRTFIEQYHGWQAGGGTELLFRTLNLSELAPTSRSDEAQLRAQYLKRVIDRVGYVLWQEIPNDPDRAGAYTHFVHPAGRVEIGPVETAEGDRIWQFTPATLDAARPLYLAIEDMPLDAGVSIETTSLFMALRDGVRALDRRLLRPIAGVELWQWIALVAFLAGSLVLAWLVAWLLFRLLLRMRREPEAAIGIRGRFIYPLQIVLVAALGFQAIRLLGLPENVDVPLRMVFGALLALAGGWLAYHAIDKLGALAGHGSGFVRFRDEMLRSLAVALGKVGVVIGSALLLAEVLSIPWQGVVAGLGIGGIAIALAARSTLENFIGGLTLLADKPIQVGDFCRFGDKLGTVEGLGLRSVKLRTLDRTLVTVPNAEFVNLYLENYTRRDSILLRTTLQLRYETTPDQLRWVLSRLRTLFLQHPQVLAEPSRARFNGFGAHSLDVELFAYVATTDYNAYLAVQEDLFLRILDIVERSGTGFAFPSTTAYLARDAGLDAEKRAAAEATVAKLREEGRLPFPDFADDERWAIFNQLEYPSPGSSGYRRAT